MHRIFIGFDPRQAVSVTTLIHSLTVNAKEPISITPLVIGTLPMRREGLTPFTWSRFLVPYLCKYEGFGLFLDADMVCVGDITEVFRIAENDPAKAVHVMKDQPDFEWASMIMFNCAHEANKVLTPEAIEKAKLPNAHKMAWLQPDLIGSLPREWNVCIPYTSNPPAEPKLLHYTQGVPYWWETKNQPQSEVWLTYANQASSTTRNWYQLMGHSVHADGVLKRLIDTGEVKDIDDYVAKAGLVAAAE